MANSNSPISVEITDKVAPTIATKIRTIGTESEKSHVKVTKLQAALVALGRANPLGRLQTELAKVTSGTTQAALASQRLATEQQRTAAASQRVATEHQRTAAAAQRVAVEQNNAATAMQRTTTEAQRTASAAQRLATEEQRTATAAAQAAAAQDRAAMSALRLQQAQERGARQAQVYARSMNLVRTALAFAGVGITAASIVGMGDAYTVLQNKLQVVATSQGQVNALTSEMFDLANRTRSEVGATTQAFVRFDRAMMGLGRSQDDTIRLTETINKALIVSGATAQESSSALLQLSQAFNSGRLNGDEFRAVSENMPIVLDALARSMGVSVGALKDLGAEGKITSTELIKALDLIESEVDAAFANTVPTMGQAFTVLRNSATQFFGELNNGLGITNTIAQAILLLADNLQRVAVYIGVAAAVFAGAYVYGLVAAAVATGGLSAALGILRTALIRTGIGALIVILGEVILKLWEVADSVGGVGRYFTILGQTGKAALDWIIAGGYAMIDAFNGITLTIGAAFTSLWASVQSGFAALMSALQAGINSMIDGLNAAFTFSINNPFTGEVMASMNGLGIATTNFAEGYVQAAADSAAAAEDLSTRADAAFESMGNRFADLRNPLDVYSEGMATARAETEAANAAAAELDGTLRGAGEGTGDTSGGAGAGGSGGGGGGGGVTKALQDYLAEMDKELEMLKLLPKEREIEREVMEKVNKLREDGINLSTAEIALLREKITTLREANAVAEQEAALMNATVYAREAQIQQMQAMQNLLNNPESGFTNADAMNALAQSEIGAYLTHLPEMVAARVDQFRFMYEQVNALRDADVISEQSASAARMQIWAAEQKAKTDVFADFFGGIAQLANSENEKMARIGKAAAITQTIIKTYQSATEAYASMAGIPVVGPALGAAAAAAAIAAGMANVAAIRSQGTSTGYMTGGYTGDMPRTAEAGVVHGREYVMDAAATSRIGQADLDALRRGAASVQRPDDAPASLGRRVSTEGAGGASGAAPAPVINQRIVNVVDPSLIGDWAASPEGEEVIINIIRKNPNAFNNGAT